MTEWQAPGLMAEMKERLQIARRLGGVCRAFVVRREDLDELRLYASAADERWKSEDVTPGSFEGVPIYALGTGEGMCYGPVFVVRSEDLERTKAAAPGGRCEVLGVEPGHCWTFVERGLDLPEIPQSD